MLNKIEFSPSENYKYGIYFLIILIACGLLYFEVIRPLNADSAALKVKLLAANTKVAQLQTFADQTPDYDAFLKIQKLKLVQAQKKIPDKISVPELVGEYNKIASANSIALTGLEPKNYIKEGIAVGLPLEMKLVGNYFNLINFLQQVENADRFVTLQSVKFTAQKNDSLELTAQFIVYAMQGDSKLNVGTSTKEVKTKKINKLKK